MGQLTPLFARQPIFNLNLNVIAYELLFRSNSINTATVTDGNQASSHVLLYAFGQHKIEDVLGDVPAFINFTEQLLLYPPPLPPSKLVVEILEDVKANDSVINSVKCLKRDGYKIALDDFTINENSRPLIKYADIIKIDVMDLSKEKIKKYVNHLKPLRITLLAEKIEDQAMYQFCVDSGFDLFQGYFLEKPSIIEGVKLTESKSAVLRLIMTLTSSDIDIGSIVNAIASDARLSYRILKIVNSTAYKTHCDIQSLNQAVTMLGIDKIKNWATFLVLSGDGSKCPELSIIGSTRAKLCELIGFQLKGKTFSEACFAVGLMSTFDAFLDMPLKDVLSQLGIAPEIESALLRHEGPLGKILQLVIAFDHADWSTVSKIRIEVLPQIEDTMLNELYGEAITWAQSIMAGLK